MTQFNAPGYEIPRATGRCAKTGRTLEPGETYYAALVELSEEELAQTADAQADKPANGASALGFKRVDVSKEAWEEGYRPPRLFGFWKSTVPEPNQKKKIFVDDAVLMSLLRRLEDATEPQRLAFRYVIALILMRKRLLRFDGTSRRDAVVDGQTIQQEWWRFTPKLDLSKGPLGKWNEEETIEVLDPQLEESRIEQVTQQLGEILEAEL